MLGEMRMGPTLWLPLMLVLHTHLSHSHFHLYYTKYHLLNNDIDHDCIYHYTTEDHTPNKREHFVPYCVRTQQLADLPCHGTKYTFKKLRENNVSSNDLYSWFAPIDLITDYELYLLDNIEDEQFFCNCSHSDHYSFGTRCQYRFAINSTSFDTIVKRTFLQKYPRDIRNLTNDDLTFYPMLNCTTYTNFSLDWRQVCDGRRDCTNGHDEEHCLQMELNECDPISEYRCRNGMCVPKSFAFDRTMDCLDFYDEKGYEDISENCLTDHSVNCEEHHCGFNSYSCGDGSCVRNIHENCKTFRNDLHLRNLFAYDIKTANMSKDCFEFMWCELGLSCLYESANVLLSNKSTCDHGLSGTAAYCVTHAKGDYLSCPNLSKEKSHQYFFFPPWPLVLPFVQMLYVVDRNIDGHVDRTTKFLCHNTSLCNMSSYKSFRELTMDDYTCVNAENYNLRTMQDIAIHIQSIFASCLTDLQQLPQATLFQCENQLLISKHRLLDGYNDCYSDEHTSDEVIKYLNMTDRFSCLHDLLRAIPRRLLQDGRQNCDDYSDELFPVDCSVGADCNFFRQIDFSSEISYVRYSELCNGYQAYRSYDNETDETNCEEWPCNSGATRCDRVWNRANGCDELGCPMSVPSAFIARQVANCSANEHYCLHYNNSRISCLPLEKANDGNIDCLFASDERLSNTLFVGKANDVLFRGRKLQCSLGPEHGLSAEDTCNRHENCGSTAEDELLCPWLINSSCLDTEFTCQNGTCLPFRYRCDRRIDCEHGEDEWACDFENRVYFKKIWPSTASILPWRSLDDHALFFCHRGILIRISEHDDRCLCPPSYYGPRCQFQSQRITVSFDSETLSTFERQTIYQLVFYLLDDRDIALSKEILTYAPLLTSLNKQLVYLLLPRSSPSIVSNLKVHIDGYIMTNNLLEHSLSWRYPVQFPFLPVNRLAIRLFFEERRINRTSCAQLACQHGTCHSFTNVDLPFCRCRIGWTGATCNQSSSSECNQLKCDRNSKCITSHSHAFCLCPLGRIGTQCRVLYNACRNVRCQNNGSCTTLDGRTQRHVCLCQTNYFGDKCEYHNARLTIDIPSKIDIISVMNIHMFDSLSKVSGVLIHRNTYFYRNVQPNSRLLINEEDQLFLPMLTLAQIVIDTRSYFGSYYLLSYTNTTNIATFTTSIVAENRCPHVSEHLNDEMMSNPWLKRIKFYHKYFKHVKCFYDEVYICLIDENQLPDCFHFNRAQNNCSSDRQYCENGGLCYQNKRSGQLNFACVCPKCIAGSFCQLNMVQFPLTLESMLGGKILVDQSLDQQSAFIKIVLALIVLLFVVGLVSNSASILTFTHPTVRQTGCGNYLLILSIVSQVTLAMFLARFVYMLISQMTIIENERFLSFSCAMFDFILSVLVSICDWLIACIACERLASVLKGVNFDKRASVRMAKRVIPLLILTLTLVSLHQPFNRALIADPRNDARLWCVIKYRYQWLRSYETTFQLINSVVPFLINVISTIVLLVMFARTKQRINTRKTYTQILVEQVQLHKDLLLSPFLIIAFTLPLTIVQISIRCIKADWQIIVSATIYLISRVPLAATFVIFIWSTPSYLKIFLEKWRKLTKQQQI